MHRLRRDQRDAGLQRRLPQPLLHGRLRCRELRLGVDAAHFILRHFERDRLAASCRARSSPRRSDRIRPCDWHCRSAPGSSAPLAVERHQPAVAERDGALAVGRVGMLDDRRAARRLASPAGRSRSDRRAGIPAPRRPRRRRARRAAAASVCGRISGVSPKITRMSSAPFSMRRLGRQHRMRGAAPLGLHEDLSLRRECACFGRDIVMLGADHDRDRRVSGRLQRLPAHAPSSERPADLVQHLRPRRAHPRAFAGRQHDRQACSRAHFDLRAKSRRS